VLVHIGVLCTVGRVFYLLVYQKREALLLTDEIGDDDFGRGHHYKYLRPADLAAIGEGTPLMADSDFKSYAEPEQSQNNRRQIFARPRPMQRLLHHYDDATQSTASLTTIASSVDHGERDKV